MMQREFITNNSKETQKLGEMLAKELQGGEVICLVGELGGGKTTFSQGLLKGLGAKGPYTSPTFVIMKEYRLKAYDLRLKSKFKIHNIYHIDAYRVKSDDILNLGWEEIIAGKENVVIIEWADRVKDIVPSGAVWISFEWGEEERRRIVLKAKG